MNRRGDKIVERRKYTDRLVDFLPFDFNEYIGDEKTKAVCERYFEKITKATIDLGFIVIKENRFRSPGNDWDALGVLAGNNIISNKLAGNLGDAKSMRNIIIHEYGYVDDELVFDSLKNELVCHVGEFLEAVK